MTLQWTVVAVVVVVSAISAAWTLMPAALRRVLAAALLRLPLPRAVAARLRRQLATASSRGCSGCDRNSLAEAGTSAAPAPPVRPITLHRRMPR
jgi:hypothetical protein